MISNAKTVRRVARFLKWNYGHIVTGENNWTGDARKLLSVVDVGIPILTAKDLVFISSRSVRTLR